MDLLTYLLTYLLENTGPNLTRKMQDRKMQEQIGSYLPGAVVKRCGSVAVSLAVRLAYSQRRVILASNEHEYVTQQKRCRLSALQSRDNGVHDT